MTKLIEMVCTANFGRSVPAELIANAYLETIGADKRYRAVSSGTMVDDIKAGKIPKDVQVKLIEQALEREEDTVYTSKEADFARTMLEADREIQIAFYANLASLAFESEERQFRTEVLPELGIEAELKTTQDQTVVNPDVVAIFTMAHSNRRQVEAIYADVESKPLIEVLRAYATGVKPAEIPNAFGKGREAYVRGFRAIERDVRLALDKYVSIH